MQKLLSIGLLAAILGLASCSDNESDNKLSKDEAQTKLKSFNTTAVSDLQSISETDGLQAIKEISSLADTDDPFQGGRIKSKKRNIKQVVRETSQKFRKFFVANRAIGRVGGETSFVFAEHLGVYEWNAAEKVFVGPTESNIEAIQIFFPADSLETENNAELRITEYTETEIDGFYEPETLSAAILINEVETVSLNFDVSWSEDQFPVKADITFFVKPYSATVQFDDSGTSASSASVSLKKNDEVLIDVSLTAKYENNIKNEANLLTVDGFVQLKNLKVQGNIDAKAADASATGDPNDFVHLTLYADGKKVGNIVFVKEVVDTNAEFIPYIQYNNGDKEKLEVVLKDVVDELNSLFN